MGSNVFLSKGSILILRQLPSKTEGLERYVINCEMFFSLSFLTAFAALLFVVESERVNIEDASECVIRSYKTQWLEKPST